ncbi:MAG: response regulator transcription factor [Syntrophales bacterium]|nr:response regulator transcription factor [Syntrophales bacterium]
MRLLLVEDDNKLASLLAKGFRQAGFAVDVAADGETGLDLALTEPYDVCVIDVMLPKIDGLSLIEQMRRNKKNTPVIILSAKRSIEDRVKGLQIGSDDYLIKPFSFSELLARVHALMRRASSNQETTKIIAGELTLDLLTREVFYGNRRIDLQPREFSLLEYFMRNSGRVLSKTMIMEHVWDYSFDPQTNVVDVLVCRLRKKLEEAAPEKEIIHTIRGVGYVLKPS